MFVYFQQKDSFWFSNCITRRIKTQVKHNVKVNAKKVNIWSSQNKCIYSLRIEINYFLKFKLSTNGSTKKVLQFQLITLSSIYNIKLRCCKKSILIEILSQNRKWGLTYAKVPLFAWIFYMVSNEKICSCIYQPIKDFSKTAIMAFWPVLVLMTYPACHPSW